MKFSLSPKTVMLMALYCGHLAIVLRIKIMPPMMETKPFRWHVEEFV